jgi:sugar fermentation stimulation protein A
MRLPTLTDGRLLRRYKRFLADVELPDGRIVTAHCPNTGSMRSCLADKAAVQLSYHDNPRRKLKWTLERIDMGNGWIGVNTVLVNSVIANALEKGQIGQFSGLGPIQREVKVERPGLEASRLDFVIADESGQSVYTEVKNVTLFEDDFLQFPDAVSVRAVKHLNLLRQLAGEGNRSVILFAINRFISLFHPGRFQIPRLFAASSARLVCEVDGRIVTPRHCNWCSSGFPITGFTHPGSLLLMIFLISETASILGKLLRHATAIVREGCLPAKGNTL